jgi:hypothetical protein
MRQQNLVCNVNNKVVFYEFSHARRVGKQTVRRTERLVAVKRTARVEPDRVEYRAQFGNDSIDETRIGDIGYDDGAVASKRFKNGPGIRRSLEFVQ